MKQSVLPMYFDPYARQRQKILRLLDNEEFIPTQIFLQLGISQYNARIYELRRGEHDGKCHLIESTRRNGIYGFSYRGYGNRR